MIDKPLTKEDFRAMTEEAKRLAKLPRRPEVLLMVEPLTPQEVFEHADRAMDICLENMAKDDKVIEDREILKYVEEQLKAMGMPEGFNKPNEFSSANDMLELLKGRK